MTGRIVTDLSPLETISLPDGSGRLILLDWSASTTDRYCNLLCVNEAGDVIWTAQLPGNYSPDCFVHVHLEGTTIRANTWSCFLVTLDSHTGQLVSAEFTK
jgi:outer membrane protein assembly factor BamB